MARAASILSQNILEFLAREPDGLEVAEIVERLSAGDGAVSERGVRNLLNQLVKEGKLIKRRGWSKKPGAPPYVYCHPNTVSRQLNLFDDIPGLKKYSLQTKSQVETGALDRQELERQKKARSVLENIAAGHIHQELYARAIVNIAPKLAEENPVELLVSMAQWAVSDLNRLGEEIKLKLKRGAVEEAQKLAVRLDSYLGWARSYFQQFWRLDRRVEGLLDEIPGILELPAQPKHFFKDGQRAHLDEEKARKRLQERIFGNKLIEKREVPANSHKAAAGTDASVADLFLDHTPGSFTPPDPVAVTTAAAALITQASNGSPAGEYQDFDIFPDKLREYEDGYAAAEGLLLSPNLKSNSLLLDEGKFQHARAAAMDRRQYEEDFRISMKQARWRSVGAAPELGISSRPTLIVRDGRVFPLEHRLQDYEAGGLFGQLIRNQIEKFMQVFHNTVLGSDRDIVYGAAVKNPEISWLAPLVFWYLHSQGAEVDGRAVVGPEDVYQFPFSDTAVSHLLFLGLANRSRDFSSHRLFVTCRVLRRFSDIVLKGEQMPAVISDRAGIRVVRDNIRKDWIAFLEQRIANKKAQHLQNIIDLDDYSPFIYLCSKVGVSMFYAAPTSAYQTMASRDYSGAHFLLPRLEVAISTERLVSEPNHEQECLDGMLSWLAAEHWDLDSAHTQSGFDTENQGHRLPILVPDVTVRAHEAVTFARTRLGEEVHDEIRALIAELRRRMGKDR
ncbi:MAG: hypothetical protein MUC60_00740 [Oscillatoria sp. Prado101]|jgi:hypothetical protein|nr:hypothetical protein [Oscillatoria sp. Prado101]